jgi:hypothetical protein
MSGLGIGYLGIGYDDLKYFSKRSEGDRMRTESINSDPTTKFPRPPFAEQ